MYEPGASSPWHHHGEWDSYAYVFAGVLRWEGGQTAIADTVKGEGEAVLHVPAPDGDLPPVGAAVEGEIDWDRRYALMRTHTALHSLSGVIFREYGAKVTGGNMDERLPRRLHIG